MERVQYKIRCTDGKLQKIYTWRVETAPRLLNKSLSLLLCLQVVLRWHQPSLPSLQRCSWRKIRKWHNGEKRRQIKQSSYAIFNVRRRRSSKIAFGCGHQMLFSVVVSIVFRSFFRRFPIIFPSFSFFDRRLHGTVTPPSPFLLVTTLKIHRSNCQLRDLRIFNRPAWSCVLERQEPSSKRRYPPDDAQDEACEHGRVGESVKKPSAGEMGTVEKSTEGVEHGRSPVVLPSTLAGLLAHLFGFG